MGIILSKFRKKKSSEEVLESIEETISNIEESQKESQLQQRRIRQFSYLSVTFLVIATFSYVYFFSKTLRRPQTVLIIIPIIILGEVLRRFISWYYQRKIKQTQRKLIDLRAQKKKILDEVMNNETFNKAKEILEKYAPDQLSKGLGVLRITHTSRATPLNMTAKTPALNNNVKKILFSTPDKSLVPSPAINNIQTLVKSHPPLNLPRPILPADKTVLEKLVEMIVGDGPSQRFALICSACNSHNGMALKEEFEYLAYKCAYCNHFNPARKQRLVAPRLPDASMRDLKGIPSMALTPSPDRFSEQNNASLSGENVRKICSERILGELDESEVNESSKNSSGQGEDEISNEARSELSNKSNEEIDDAITGCKDGEDKDQMAMEVDESYGERDLGEYVSDEDSIPESDSPRKEAEVSEVQKANKSED